MSEKQDHQEALVRLLTLNPSRQDIPTRELTLTREKPTVIIGRTSKRKASLGSSFSNAYFDCPVISRTHAELRVDGHNSKIILKDLGSLHGTRLNRLPLAKNEVRNVISGDIITLGMPIERGAEHYAPYEVEAQITWMDRRSSNASKTFTVPDDSDVEEIIDEDDAMATAERVMRQHNYFPRLGETIDLTNDCTIFNAPATAKRANESINLDPDEGLWGTHLPPLPPRSGSNHHQVGDDPVTDAVANEWETTNTSASGIPETDGFEDSLDFDEFPDDQQGSTDSEASDDDDESASSDEESSSMSDCDQPHKDLPYEEADRVESHSPVPSAQKDQHNYEAQNEEQFMRTLSNIPVVLPPNSFSEDDGHLSIRDHIGYERQQGPEERPWRCPLKVPEIVSDAPTYDDIPSLSPIDIRKPRAPFYETSQQTMANKPEYFHAREVNCKTLGLPPLAERQTAPTLGRTETTRYHHVTPPQLSFPKKSSPILAGKEGLDGPFGLKFNPLAESGIKFLSQPEPMASTVESIPVVEMPDLDDTSAFSLQMSKQAAIQTDDCHTQAQVPVDDEPHTRPAPAQTSDVSNNTAQPMTKASCRPPKRKSDEISSSMLQEATECVPRLREVPDTNSEPALARRSGTSFEQAPEVTTRVAPNLPRSAKRLRRAAEVFGYAAAGGIAVMSALIATAPAL